MHRKEKLVALCLTLMLILAYAVALAAPKATTGSQGAAATGAPVIALGASVTDEAGLLSEGEKNSLTAAIQKVEKAHGVRIGIYTTKVLPQGYSPEKLANKLVDDYYSDAANGGMVLILAMKERDWHLSTNNPMRQRITDDAGFPYLRDSFLSQLSDGKYAGAFTTLVQKSDEMLTYYEKEGKPYDPASEFNILAAVAAVIIAALGGFMVRASMIASMSNVQAATEADTYLKRDSVNIKRSHDTYLFTNVTRTAKSKKSSDSSSGDGGGGGSHGGGGGKF
ncbi:MAG: TPM domain-containing protein [Selenomonadaceae bacterium]|nr:TPM domain-containing protein [Selenomonadaceae bacterium]